MAEPIDDLIALSEAAMQEITQGLAEGLSPEMVVDTWEAEMAQWIARASHAAAMLGAESVAVSPAAAKALAAFVQVQLEWLAGFAIEVASAAEYQKGWEARAALYARAIKTPYWQNKTKMLPLPAMPAQGTICGPNCQCQWDVKELDDRYEATWVRHARDSCQTCMQREADWSPYIIPKDEAL